MNDSVKRMVPYPYIGPVLFVLFLLVYGITMIRGPVPGTSAHLVAQQLGLDPFPSTLYPIWGTLIQLVAWLNPLGRVSLSVNALSVFFSAASVWLMYEVVSRLPHLYVALHKEELPSKKPARVAGVASAFLLASCLPFWLTATQAHHLPLEIALLLVAALLFLLYFHTQDVRRLYAFTIVYGIGTVESVLFIVTAPLFAVCLVVLLAVQNRLRVRFIGRLLLLYVAGLTLYLYAAWRIYRLPGFDQWLEYKGFLHVVWFIWVEQYHLMRFGLGQLGWLIVFMTTMLPSLIFLAMPRLLSSRRAIKPGPLLLHLTLTVVAVLLLFNAPISPWITVGRTHLAVFPYLLWALYGGYLVGYWYAVLGGRYTTRSRATILRKFRPAWLVVVALTISVAGYLNLPLVSQKETRAVHMFVGEVLDALGEREWLISNGVLDHILMLMAHEQGQTVRVLNPRLARNPAYLRYLSSLFDDLHLKSLASLGLVPLLNEWIEHDEQIHEQLAVLIWDELWSSRGLYPVPEGVLYGGVRTPEDIDVDALYERNHALWSRVPARAPDQPSEAMGLLGDFSGWYRAHMSRVANNFGVMLEDLNEPDKAYEAYRASRALNPDNISALLNMASLANRIAHPDAETLNKEVELLAALPDHELRHWSLTARYGTVRHPETYARRGLSWAMSGKADMAIADIQRAIQAGAEEDRLSFVLASLYFDDEQFEESERLYNRILRENPDHPTALLGLARIASRRGHFDLARGYLDRLKELRAMPIRVRLEEGIIEVLSGREQEGRRLLESLVKDQPGVTTAWAILVMLALSQEDDDLLNRSLKALGELGAVDIRSLMIIAHAQMSQNQLFEARNTLERAVRVQPDYVPIHEQILRLDVAEMNKDAARRRVEIILSLDSRNALANYILGSLHYAAGNLMLAESAFRSSIRTAPTAEALNDLAWLLYLRGEYEEAYDHIRQSLELNLDNPYAWSTNGAILTRRGDHEKAYAAFQQALQRSPDNPRIQLGLALLHEETGRQQEALSLVDEILEQISWLTENERRRALELSTRLRRGTSPR